MRCSTCVFYFHVFFSRFSRVFPRVYDTNMLVSKTRVKTQEKHMKNVRKVKNASPTREDVSILHFFITLFYFHVFYSRFTRALLAFLFTNANQKHSVIGAQGIHYLNDNLVTHMSVSLTQCAAVTPHSLLINEMPQL